MCQKRKIEALPSTIGFRRLSFKEQCQNSFVLKMAIASQSNVIDGLQKRGYEVGRSLLNHFQKNDQDGSKPLPAIEFDTDNVCVSNDSDVTRSITCSER
jgi:hypothetical protein